MNNPRLKKILASVEDSAVNNMPAGAIIGLIEAIIEVQNQLETLQASTSKRAAKGTSQRKPATRAEKR